MGSQSRMDEKRKSTHSLNKTCDQHHPLPSQTNKTTPLPLVSSALSHSNDALLLHCHRPRPGRRCRCPSRPQRPAGGCRAARLPPVGQAHIPGPLCRQAQGPQPAGRECAPPCGAGGQGPPEAWHQAPRRHQRSGHRPQRDLGRLHGEHRSLRSLCRLQLVPAHARSDAGPVL